MSEIFRGLTIFLSILSCPGWALGVVSLGVVPLVSVIYLVAGGENIIGVVASWYFMFSFGFITTCLVMGRRWGFF